MALFHSPEQIRASKIAYWRQQITAWREWQKTVRLPENRFFADNQITLISQKIITLQQPEPQ